MRRWRQWIWWGLAIASLVAVAVWSLMPRPILVEVATVKQDWLEVSIRQDGMTRIKDRYRVSAVVPGRLQRIALRPGDPIRRGDTVLALIQPTLPTMLDARQSRQLEANVEAARRQVELAEARRERAIAELSQAESQYGRLQTLKEQGGASQAEFEAAQTAYRSRSEELRMATFEWEIRGFELEQAQVARQHFSDDSSADLAQLEVRAPIDGQVLRVFEESSTVVPAGTPLLEVGNPADLEIVIDVLSTDAVQVQPGNPVILEHWGGERPLMAEVRRVEPAAYTKVSALGVEEQRVNVIADFREPQGEWGRLGDQFRVEARIVVWKGEQVTQVPTSALFRNQEEWAVFVVRGQQIFRQNVVIGKRNQTMAEIVEGLEPEQRVVIYPSDLLRDGTRVTFAVN